MDSIEEAVPFQLSSGFTGETTVSVVKEYPLTVVLNNREIVTLLCSPKELRYLTAGFLQSEGFIRDGTDIKSIDVDEQNGIVNVDAAESGDNVTGVSYRRIMYTSSRKKDYFSSAADFLKGETCNEMEIAPDEITSLVEEFQNHSEVYKTTHGIHGAALCDREKLVVFSEDIGRHNAIDKVFGKCLLDGIDIRNRLLLTTGRVSSELLYKALMRNIPIIVSISVPTSLGIQLANTTGVTLISATKSGALNIYSGKQRVIRLK